MATSARSDQEDRHQQLQALFACGQRLVAEELNEVEAELDRLRTEQELNVDEKCAEAYDGFKKALKEKWEPFDEWEWGSSRLITGDEFDTLDEDIMKALAEEMTIKLREAGVPEQRLEAELSKAKAENDEKLTSRRRVLVERQARHKAEEERAAALREAEELAQRKAAEELAATHKVE